MKVPINKTIEELKAFTFERLVPINLREKNLEIDLRSVGFVDPYGMVSLIILAKSLSLKSIEVKIFLPDSQDVLNYLERMDFFKEVPSCINFDKDISYLQYNIRNPSESLKEVKKICREEDVVDIVDTFANILVTRHRFNRQTVNKFSEIMIETFQNIPQHSSSSTDDYEPEGIAAIQDYKDHIYLALGDAGIGIKTSLLQNPRYRRMALDDTRAIANVLKYGFSRYDVPGRGGGLQRVLSIVTRFNGQLLIRSMQGLVFARKGKMKCFTVGNVGGTLIGIRIPKQVFLQEST